MKQNALSLSYLLIITICFACSSKKNSINQSHKPNILWITCEDITTMLGCYGDSNALTPTLDKLAREGIQFNHAFSTAAVCSPARSCLVTGVYATSLGTQNLRSEFSIPAEIRTLPHILRENGYYCTNNYKEDYNFTDPSIWDESSHTAHWRNRPEDQPFFSVFNLETTHQSQIFGDDETFYEKYGKLLTDAQRHDPQELHLAPYYFDSKEVRKLWARYYDLVTIMDQQIAEILDQLKEDGLEENTIIFYFSDHGTGMPRAKRALYNSGVQVPFILYMPEKFEHLTPFSQGNQISDMVSFIDFPPSVLSLAGIVKPAYMTGTPFIGEYRQTPGDFAFATSDRVDEAFELTRTVKSSKYSYIRNFLPHLPLIQPNFYSDQSEIMKELYRFKDSVGYEGMTEAQQSMWHAKRAPEELYDLENDPFEVTNLAPNPSYKDVLAEMRMALKNWMIKTHDTGLVPEAYLVEKTGIEPAYEVAQRSETYPIEEILYVNDMILIDPIDQDGLIEKLSAPHALVRYWAAISLHYLATPGKSTIKALRASMSDNSKIVRLAAAETLCAYNESDNSIEQIILDGLNSTNEVEMLYASRIYELYQDKLPGIKDRVMKFHKKICDQSSGKWKGYDLYSCWALTEAFKDEKE